MEKVKATIVELEDKFVDLTADAEDELCEKEGQDRRFLTKFKKRLFLLPVAKKAPHVKLFRESEKDIVAAKNTSEIMPILCRYIDYRNYKILHRVITTYGSAQLQKNMQQYCENLEEFERATTVDVYKRTISAGKKLEVAFSQMVLKVGKSESNCTLYELRKLKEEIAEEASLHSHSVYIESESVQCVEVMVRFPSSAVGWVLSAMTPAFMHTHLLSEVAVDGRQLTIFEADSDVLVSGYLCNDGVL